MHNILQGVAKPHERLSDQDKESIRGWIVDTAKRYWLENRGPLRPSAEGGADIVVVGRPPLAFSEVTVNASDFERIAFIRVPRPKIVNACKPSAFLTLTY